MMDKITTMYYQSILKKSVNILKYILPNFNA